MHNASQAVHSLGQSVSEQVPVSLRITLVRWRPHLAPEAVAPTTTLRFG